MAENDKIRYEKEKKEFDEKGFYTMADGKKSTEVELTRD